MFNSRSFSFTLFALSLFTLFTLPVHAYLDPASGSMMLQMILGGLAGIALAIKLFWHKVLGFFGFKGKDTNEDSAE